MAHTFTNLLYHLVFSTKGRVPQIDAELQPRLFPYMGGIVRELGGVPVIVKGTEDPSTCSSFCRRRSPWRTRCES